MQIVSLVQENGQYLGFLLQYLTVSTFSQPIPELVCCNTYADCVPGARKWPIPGVFAAIPDSFHLFPANT